MFDVGFSELLLVFVIALLVFGPERLPRIASQVGRWVGRARRMAGQLRYQLEQEITIDELTRARELRDIDLHSILNPDAQPGRNSNHDDDADVGETAAVADQPPVTQPASRGARIGAAYSSAYVAMDDDTFDEFAENADPIDADHEPANACGGAPEPLVAEPPPAAVGSDASTAS